MPSTWTPSSRSPDRAAGRSPFSSPRTASRSTAARTSRPSRGTASPRSGRCCAPSPTRTGSGRRTWPRRPKRSSARCGGRRKPSRRASRSPTRCSPTQSAGCSPSSIRGGAASGRRRSFRPHRHSSSSCGVAGSTRCASRSTGWPQAGCTTSWAAASTATPWTPSGLCRISRRCCTTTRSSSRCISTPGCSSGRSDTAT